MRSYFFAQLSCLGSFPHSTWQQEPRRLHNFPYNQTGSFPLSFVESKTPSIPSPLNDTPADSRKPSCWKSETWSCSRTSDTPETMRVNCHGILAIRYPNQRKYDFFRRHRCVALERVSATQGLSLINHTPVHSAKPSCWKSEAWSCRTVTRQSLFA